MRDPELDVLTPGDRDRMLEAMTECCATLGYQATSVEQVIVRAGVDRESFDLLFSGKEACAIAALNLISVMISRVHAAGGGAAVPPQAARAALGGAEALVRRAVIAGRTRQLQRLLPDLIYGMLVPLVGQAEALRLSRPAADPPRGGLR